MGQSLGEDPGCCLAGSGKWGPLRSRSWVLPPARVTWAAAAFQPHSPTLCPVQPGRVSISLPVLRDVAGDPWGGPRRPRSSASTEGPGHLHQAFFQRGGTRGSPTSSGPLVAAGWVLKQQERAAFLGWGGGGGGFCHPSWGPRCSPAHSLSLDPSLPLQPDAPPPPPQAAHAQQQLQQQQWQHRGPVSGQHRLLRQRHHREGRSGWAAPGVVGCSGRAAAWGQGGPVFAQELAKWPGHMAHPPHPHPTQQDSSLRAPSRGAWPSVLWFPGSQFCGLKSFLHPHPCPHHGR